jgi:serine/threonine protein kinase/Tol biopolymer transport system component
MGEVYLAKDLKLGRRVALKILPSDLTQNKDLLNRFIQEARTTSALDHPNIITIYETDCHDAIHIIAMEFIDGVTLHQHIAHAPVKPDEALDIAIQVASALAAAHGAGIIHRDIKPHNIMLRRDGFVKVLDFGLAKLTERALKTDKEDPTPLLIHTEPGVVLGTPNYMSPEQIRGLTVNVRTDLWSLGCVLYEMVTGHVPFEGATPNDVIAQILEREPSPLARYTHEATETLEWIVMKALTRDQDERYQTAKEMSADMKKLRWRLEIDAKAKRSPDLSGSRSIPSSGEYETPVATETAQEIESTATADPHARPPLHTEQVVTGIHHYKKLLLLGLAALVIAIIAIAFNWHKLFSPTIPPKIQGTPITSTRLVTEYGANNASISPDGNFVVYVAPARDSEGNCLWIMQTAQGPSVPITKAIKDASITGTCFSPSGDIVYYIIYSKADPLGALYQVPAIGGYAPKPILKHINSPISLSPDGKQFAFIRWQAAVNESALMVANIDGSGKPEVLGPPRGRDQFVPALAWSKDGKKIATAVSTSTGGYSTTLVEISVKDKSEHQLTSRNWAGGIFRIFWLKDDNGLIINAKEKDGSPMQLWHVSYPLGEAKIIANNFGDYDPATLGVTENSSTLIAGVVETSLSIGVASLNSIKSRPQFISTDKYDGCGGMSWTPDNRIVYGAKRGDDYHIWIMKEDGSDNTPLTSGAYSDGQPRVSPNGRHIVFSSNREGNIRKIWRMDLNGGNLKQLTMNEGYSPSCSPDGKWVVYVSEQDGKPNLWKVPLEENKPEEKICDKVLLSAEFSPKDGKRIACLYYNQDTKQNEPVLISFEDDQFEDGHIVKQIDFPQTAVSPPSWMPDGQSLFYLDTTKNCDNFWSQNIANNKRVQVTKFDCGRIGCFKLSNNGKIVLSSVSLNSNIYLIKDFQ